MSRGELEQALLARGRARDRVAPKLMGERGAASASPARRIRSTRSLSPRGRCARASSASRSRILDERAMEIRLMAEHRERHRRRAHARAETGCAGTWSSSARTSKPACPRARSTASAQLDRVVRALRAAAQPARACASRASSSAHPRSSPARANALERELRARVRAHEPRAARGDGCGTLTAATMIGRDSGRRTVRHRRAASRARAGTPRSPPPRATASVTACTAVPTASSTARCTSIAITRARRDPETRAYLERKHRRGQDAQGSHPLPQTPPRPPLPPPAHRTTRSNRRPRDRSRAGAPSRMLCHRFSSIASARRQDLRPAQRPRR